MDFQVLTLFPDMVEHALRDGIIGRAIEDGIIRVNTVNIRDFAGNKHGSVDDYPYGGGAGMLMQAEPIYQAYRSIVPDEAFAPRCIFVTPQGRVFDQRIARELALEEELIFLCGRYEGVDERVLSTIVTDEISIGDYVVTGGEMPALIMIDAIARMIPGVLHNESSAEGDSFYDGLLEYPQYTRPEEWRGMRVPQILLSGDHAKVDAWRRTQSLLRTAKRRPDLYREAAISPKEQEEIRNILANENNALYNNECCKGVDDHE